MNSEKQLSNYNNISDYDYNLPVELIAQQPAAERVLSRLLTVDRNTGQLSDHVFADIVDILSDEYFLVVNNTKVIPARMPAVKSTGGKSEIFLLEFVDEYACKALVRGKARAGDNINIGDDFITLNKQLDDGSWLVLSYIPMKELMHKYGKIPLPPYIQREANADDRERYQTVYATEDGSVAAPTAGLHFSNTLMEGLAAKGIETVALTLHVGIGTFRPIKTETLDEHEMHTEHYHISADAADKINSMKVAGKKLLAVGTTSVRTLESASDDRGRIYAGSSETKLFIRPGYRFKVVDAMLTNFHLPKSSLVVMVSAFMGMELRKKTYEHAIAERYRFFSYGDVMLIK